MATVIPKYNRIVQDQPQQAFYMVSIDTSGFLDTETNNGGRISPCVAEDFATAPNTHQSKWQRTTYDQQCLQVHRLAKLVFL